MESRSTVALESITTSLNAGHSLDLPCVSLIIKFSESYFAFFFS